MSTANIKVTFLCASEKVWDTVTDLSNYKWRSDIDRIKIIDNSRFIEYSKEGIPTIFKITKKKRYHLWEFKVENENIKGTWTGKFYPQGEKTTLDFTESVTAKKFHSLGNIFRNNNASILWI